MNFIKHECLKTCFKGYAIISDEADKYSIIAFSKDFGNTWNIRSAWVISDAVAEVYNKNLNPEESNQAAYTKKDSWVFGDCYYEESGSIETPELCSEIEALEAAKDEFGIIEFMEKHLIDLLNRSKK